MSLAAVSCGGGSSVPSAPTAASASVTISGQTSALAPNMKLQLAATLKNPDGSTADCTSTAAWSSSNDKLLKVTGTSSSTALSLRMREGVKVLCEIFNR